MDTESAVWNWVLCFRSWLPLRKRILRMVMVLVLLVPATLEYLFDLHAKKNGPLIRSAICLENSSLGLNRYCE